MREELERVLATVDPEEVAAEVQFALELIDVESLWARAGRHRYGYTEPHEAAWEMLEETLQPYLERMNWYRAGGRHEAYDAYALGVLRGLYDFHHESDSEWKEWAPDQAGDKFDHVLDEWERHRDGAAERQAMRDQLASWCPGWGRRAAHPSP